MQFLRAIYLVIYTEIRYRVILFLNRKLIKVLKEATKKDPKLQVTLRLAEDNPWKIEYDMSYLD